LRGVLPQSCVEGIEPLGVDEGLDDAAHLPSGRRAGRGGHRRQEAEFGHPADRPIDLIDRA